MTSQASRVRVLLAVVLIGLVAACGTAKVANGKPLSERLADAKSHIDQAQSLVLDLSAESFPSGVSGVKSANGVVTRQPAFQGTIAAVTSGITLNVPVVAVDGKVHAQVFGVWQEIDPAQYGVPNPATLFDPNTGISSYLTATTNLVDGGQTRDGKAINSTIKGTISGTEIGRLIPTADKTATFQVSYSLNDAGQLVGARITGPFFGSTSATYDLQVSGYGQTQTIKAP